MKVFYLPLEPYKERYTWQLNEWMQRAFKRNDIDYRVIIPAETFETKSGDIEVSSPLDYWRRTKYSLHQMAALVDAIRYEANDGDVILLNDMFHCGIEAIPYILQQENKKMHLFTQNCAQSMDIYDFTYKMLPWMRHYEMMTHIISTGTFVASQIHKELMMAAGFDESKIYCCGLPFDWMEVVHRQRPIAWQSRSNRVVFTSRWDDEKQPLFYLKVIDYFYEHYPNHQLEFALIQGSKLKSNNQLNIDKANEYEAAGKLTIYENCSKEDYYQLLAQSKCQFNCALQDFVSNTLNESSALIVPTVAPAFRGFPECMQQQWQNLYTPWIVEDAAEKIMHAVSNEPNVEDIAAIFSVAEESSKTIDKWCEIIKNL